ncbi:succinate dehydrogenase, cytochrome b556 subunit [Roseibium marinum]|uniref:Succinate dehydrogenase cytochrome b556 subunit n=1 Tax=Roseibium marinum TaxID=281252 RepID=A0A2S3V264_9HYPH|nr:succinate dehydrogenase, cytochrome b556 subunit [Roseibium marinum]POF34038.1 succinate dehydrogenase subunit C [Roseibium marinum]
MSNADLRGNRPLSPHLQIYKPILTMVMSILHRITGAALYFGTVLLAWWLIAAAAGPSYFDFVNGIYGSILGRLVLFGFTWALVHHMLGGLRHLIWAMGAGFGKEAREWMAKATIIGSVSLTLILWVIGYLVR